MILFLPKITHVVDRTESIISMESTAAKRRGRITSLRGEIYAPLREIRGTLIGRNSPRGHPGHPGSGTAPRAEEELEMSQRNRIALAAALLAALFLTAPAPSHAVVHPSWQLPLTGVWERAWSWLAQILPGGAPQKPGVREKEGGAINPDGRPTPGLISPVPTGTQSDEGGAINPDGSK